MKTEPQPSALRSTFPFLEESARLSCQLLPDEEAGGQRFRDLNRHYGLSPWNCSLGMPTPALFYSPVTSSGESGWPFPGFDQLRRKSCAFPVSNRSTDLPNSRLIAKRTAAPGSFSPLDMDSTTSITASQAKQPRMRHVPLAIQEQEIAGSDGEVVPMQQHFQLLGLQFG
jgi:hypothetical protein